MALNFTFSAFADEVDPNFDLQLAALKRNRIPLLEIRGVDGKGVLDLTDAELETVCEKLAEAGIGVSAVGSPIGKIGIRDDFAPHFEKFKRAVEIAKKLGTTRIRMFSFFIPQGEDPESCFDEVVRAFRRSSPTPRKTACTAATKPKRAFTATRSPACRSCMRPCPACAACSTRRTTSSAATTPP